MTKTKEIKQLYPMIVRRPHIEVLTTPEVNWIISHSDNSIPTSQLCNIETPDGDSFELNREEWCALRDAIEAYWKEITPSKKVG